MKNEENSTPAPDMIGVPFLLHIENISKPFFMEISIKSTQEEIDIANMFLHVNNIQKGKKIPLPPLIHHEILTNYIEVYYDSVFLGGSVPVVVEFFIDGKINNIYSL